MLALFRAEWKKATGNLLLTGFTVAIIPVGLASYMVIAFLISFVSKNAALVMIGEIPGNWTNAMIGVWSFLIAFPGNVLGRLLPLAYMAVLFGGEYQWGTLRLVLPRIHRAPLILVKAGTTVLIVLIAYVITTIVLGLGQALAPALLGLEHGPALTSSELSEFAFQYFWHLLLSFLSLLILAGFAALASVLTRSILGGVLGGLGLSVLEPMSLVILILLGRMLNRPELANFYQFAATYHLDNARSWISAGRPIPPPLEGFTAEPALSVSLMFLVGWVVALIALSIVLFRRQDVTS